MSLMKFRDVFQKEAYVSAFLISGANLLHSFIAYGKKEFLKDTIQQNDSKIQPLFHDDLWKGRSWSQRKAGCFVLNIFYC